MKFGVKTYNSEEFLDAFEDDADFFEIQAIRGNDYSFLKKYDKPIVIHCEHQGFGVNIADSTREDFNLEAIDFAKGVADMVGAEKIIVHPGTFENENCSEENAISFLKKYCDEKFCLENMPPIDNPKNKIRLVCISPEEITRFSEKTGLGFCLDVNHAIEYALNKGVGLLGSFEGVRETQTCALSFGRGADKGRRFAFEFL